MCCQTMHRGSSPILLALYQLQKEPTPEKTYENQKWMNVKAQLYSVYIYFGWQKNNYITEVFFELVPPQDIP